MIEPSPFWATPREVTSISAAVMHSLLEIEPEEALQPKAPKQRDDGEALEMIPMPVFSRPYRLDRGGELPDRQGVVADNAQPETPSSRSSSFTTSVQVSLAPVPSSILQRTPISPKRGNRVGFTPSQTPLTLSPQPMPAELPDTSAALEIDVPAEDIMAPLDTRSAVTTDVRMRVRPAVWNERPSKAPRLTHRMEGPHPYPPLTYRRSRRESTQGLERTPSRSRSGSQGPPSRRTSDGVGRDVPTVPSTAGSPLLFARQLRPRASNGLVPPSPQPSFRLLHHPSDHQELSHAHVAEGNRGQHATPATPLPPIPDNSPTVEATSRAHVRQTTMRGRRAVPHTRGFSSNSNYSSSTIYHDMPTAVGLALGTPFQAAGSLAPDIYLTGYAQEGLSYQGLEFSPTPHPSRASTGDVGLAAILDGIQSPQLRGTSPEGHTLPDFERFAPVTRNATDWKPTWEVFPLKVFRGMDFKIIEIKPDWDDEVLLRELSRAYDELRTWLRKWFSMKGVWYVTMVTANHSYIYPQRVGTAKYTAHRNMRMRYLLDHPEHMKGQRELMRALTERPDYGVEFVERLVVIRVCIPAFGSAVIALLIAIVYGAVKGDWPGGFGIASFFSQTFAMLVGVIAACLHLYEF